MPVNKNEVFFASVAELEAWLEQHFEAEGIWAAQYKNSTGKSDLHWETLVSTCLRFGWIDSVPGKVDAERTKTYISPRRIGSGWSRKNQLTILELEQAGKLHPNGLAVLQRSRADGSWTLFDKAEDLVVPKELRSVFDANPELLAGWERSSEAKRRQELQLFYSAKTPPTIEKRLKRLIELASSRA